MDLRTYRDRRDFKNTREPRGKARACGGNSFVVQKHAARRLHYDLRLELDGVLKSWAVTKGPSLVPGEKRLAVEVEDHPVEYATFEGGIPKGQYGGGSVIIWDRGTWTPHGDPHRGLANGHLDFELAGEKLRGGWHLLRMQRRGGEKRNNWLLIKSEDAAARGSRDPDILEAEPRSVASGRLVEDIGADDDVWDKRVGHEAAAAGPRPTSRPAAARSADKAKASAMRDAPSATAKAVSGLRRRNIQTARSTAPCASVAAGTTLTGAAETPMPDFIPPCLATLTRKPPEGEQWIHETKFDGYRLQAHLRSGKVKLYTRSGLDWTEKFGARIPAALARLKLVTAIIDGELVAERGDGISDFAILQADLKERRSDRFVFQAFDLLYEDGRDLRAMPLMARQDRLKAILPARNSGPLRFSKPLGESGALALRRACRMKLEGVVSKLRTAPYRSGRVTAWLKSKCSDRQEFVIVGYVPSTASKRAIGSLVLGYYQKGELIYAGRVGTGFTETIASSLWQLLVGRRVKAPPFAGKLSATELRGVAWVKPERVAEVEFRGWTRAGILRQASFQGLRDDKPAGEIVREEARAAPARLDEREQASAKPTATSPVRLTHPDRVYWPDAGVTKQALADYYTQVWRWIAPHVLARPLALLRCPSGIGEPCFFQKQPWRGLDKSIAVLENPGAGGDKILAIGDLDGLVALVQSGVLEIHPWGSTVADLDHPDRLIFDLDPGPGTAWSALVDAANEVRKRLDRDGLTSFVKTSGGRGLHVVAPLVPKADWDGAKAYARNLAVAMAQENAALYTAAISKQVRDSRVFIDYLRNARGATVVAPYSTRARAGAPVSAPVSWKELPKVHGDDFRVSNMASRLNARRADPWAGFFTTEQGLPTTGRSAKPAPRKSVPRSRKSR